MKILEPQTNTSKAFSLPLDVDDIKENLSNLNIDYIRNIEVLQSTTSTNDYLLQKKYVEQSEIAVCVAEEQTCGRGRFGHQWQSPKGVNVYLSLLWPVMEWYQRYEILGLHLLTSMAKMFEQLEISNIQLKWPNDLCINEKKLGGILIERKSFQSIHNLIIGVGINVTMSSVAPIRIETPWIDLISIHPDWQMSRNELTARIVSVVAETLSKLENDDQVDLTSIWQRYDLLYQRKIEFTHDEQRKTGVAQGIDKEGKIIIEMEGRRFHLHSAHLSDITL